MKLALHIVSLAALSLVVLACSRQPASSGEYDLRGDISQQGPSHLIETLKRYPDPEAPTIRSRSDFEFLMEIFHGKVSNPDWISPSLAEYPRARSLAASYLAHDHQNRHFFLSPKELLAVRTYGQSILASANSGQEMRLEAISMLGATGALEDVATIETAALTSSDVQEIEQVLMSLALMCHSAAGNAMDRVLNAKQPMLREGFKELVVSTRVTKQKGLCAQ
jgi:hypothetical protein